MKQLLTAFLPSYHQARDRFRQSLPLVQAVWPRAQVCQYSIPDDGDLTIDWISAPARKDPRRCLVITTGLHGIEGIVGSAVLDTFIQCFLERFNPSRTSLVLVHILNPWGMKNFRKTNLHHVDLNRNFFFKKEALPLASNPAVDQVNSLIKPGQPLKSFPLEKGLFFLRLAQKMLRVGRTSIQEASLLGQYRFPDGIYYGGTEIQAETRLMQNLFFSQFEKCDQLLHLDIHTGYGPGGVMTLVNSPLESSPPGEYQKHFSYPWVTASGSKDFYAIQGDMIDWLYRMGERFFPEKKLFSTTFEFGTLGDSTLALIRSLRAAVFENQLYWHGSSNETTARRVREEYLELYAPQDPAWQEKALKSASRAFEGILSWAGFFEHQI